MSSEDERAAFIEQVIARARKRWSDALPDDRLTLYLADLRLLLFTHPVAIEYVARAMPRTAPTRTEERGEPTAKKVVSGGG